MGSRASAFGSAAYGLDDQGGRSSSPGKVKNFYFSIPSRPALASYAMGTRDSAPGVKRLGRESEHSPLTGAEVKRIWV
jgi:hypothetical protein